MTQLSLVRGDHFALTVNLQRDGTDWSGSTVGCQLRTNTQQLIADCSTAGYITTNTATANTLSIALSVPNTVTAEFPSNVYGDIQVYNTGISLKTVTPVQFRIAVSDDFTR